MQARYVMEMVVYFALVAIFQFGLVYFTNTWNDGIKLFNKVAEIEKEGELAI